MNRKIISFKQSFYPNYAQCQKLQQVSEVQSFGLDTGAQLFCYSFIALSIAQLTIVYWSDFAQRNTLFEVRPEIRCLGVSSATTEFQKHH